MWCCFLITNPSVDLVVGQPVCVETSGKSGVVDHTQLHFWDFFVDALNELENKIYNLLLLESLQVIITNEEREVVLWKRWLLSQDLELVSTQGNESFKHVGQQDFNFCGFFDCDGYAHTVNTRFNQTLFCFTLWDHDVIQEELWVVFEFNFWVDLVFYKLRWEKP